MGLDSVELILAVEDAFQIHISDEEAGEVCTIGDIHRLVVSKIQWQDSKGCLTSAAFHRTRRGIVSALGIDRREIRPSTLLEAILPRKTRCEKWRQLQRTMKLRMPNLRLPLWIFLGFLVSVIALAMVPALHHGANFVWVPLWFFAGLKLAPRFAVAFPKRDATVGDLARDVLALNYGLLASENITWNESGVWEAVCRIVVLETGVAREKVKPEARVCDDLGID